MLKWGTRTWTSRDTSYMQISCLFAEDVRAMSAIPAQVGRQNLDMRRAMTIMKEQAAEMALKAQAAAAAAAADRKAADEKLAAANDALSMERAKIVALQVFSKLRIG